MLKVCALLLVATSAAAAFGQVVWYTGDLANDEYILNQVGGSIDARVYEDFRFDHEQSIGSVFADFSISYEPFLAVVSIRRNLRSGFAGENIFNGMLGATSTPLDGGTSTGGNRRVMVDLPFAVTLNAGETYWLSVAPVSFGPSESAVLGTTNGANSVGSPVGNGNSFFVYQTGGYNYVPTEDLVNNPNWSMGVSAVPEPVSLVILGAGVLAAIRRRK